MRVSYGVATYLEDSIHTEDALKRRTDERMYEMKDTHLSNVITE